LLHKRGKIFKIESVKILKRRKKKLSLKVLKRRRRKAFSNLKYSFFNRKLNILKSKKTKIRMWKKVNKILSNHHKYKLTLISRSLNRPR
jgi:vacuolar-type H+-ATPase subunit I/STV1